MISAFGSRWLAAAVLAVLACGGGGGGGGNPTAPTPPGPGSPSTSASVAMSGGLDSYGYEVNTFTPSTVTIGRNGTVTWSNPTGRVHNVTFSAGGAPANIPDHSSGSNVRTFATSGTFSYQCNNHAAMSGSVTVQ